MKLGKTGLPIPALILLSLLALSLWWQSRAPAESVSGFSLFAMGTVVDIRLADPIESAQLIELQAALRSQLDAFETTWSVRRDGALAALNRELEDSPTAVPDATLLGDLRLAANWCALSAGRFDPGIGALIRLWGFEDEADMLDRPPEADALAPLTRHDGCSLTLSDGRLSLPAPGYRLNFGAMAKGRAVQLLAESLRRRGYRNFIVNAGGDLQVGGQHPRRAWRIGVRDPRSDNPEQALASITLADGEALFSSGDYERFFEHAGQRYHHLLDPATGQPARDAISATVLHTDAALADAAATALFVAGREQAAAVAAALELDTWMLIGPDGQVHSSPQMQQRLQWLE